MSIRITEQMVTEIYTKQNKDLSLTPFIIIASQMVDKIEEYIIDNNGTVKQNNLVSIETFLAAHFTTTLEKVTKSESAGDVSESYSLITKTGLRNCHYGQSAILLDFSGWLKKYDNGEISDIVQITTHVVHYDPSQLDDITGTIAEFFQSECLPTNTLVGVDSLSTEGLLIEIGGIAVTSVN